MVLRQYSNGLQLQIQELMVNQRNLKFIQSFQYNTVNNRDALPSRKIDGYKHKNAWNMSCILVRIFDWWLAIGREGLGSKSSLFTFFLLLSWKNCCIISAHSDAINPRRIVIFGWKGWTGAAGLSVSSEPFSPPGKSLQKFLSYIRI